MGLIAIQERDYDNRTIVHSTPRYRGTTTCFTSGDDDQTDPSRVWGGANDVQLHHEIGDAATQNIYLDFNTIANKTYILSGFLEWKDALQDHWSCFIVPQTTTYIAGTNTNYTLFGGYLIIPAAGDGDITVDTADFKLIQITKDEYGVLEGAGYWDADYNTTTKAFENIVANVNGTGEFNLFGVEVTLSRYVNELHVLGDGEANLTAFDAAQLGHGMRLKFDIVTAGTDHDWYFNGSITMFREKTT